ncbi:MAG: DUF342 domain-containing protein [Gemmatimonadetes bacterium]|jgi:uncharacterized protein (DUF342 family)|nr:DUF342 domain-containing protein [Gemmatimonadota bacterium]
MDATAADGGSPLLIDGDVDEERGSIDADRDLRIAGSVRSNITVKTTGSVEIGGEVGAGAQIDARGDVSVSGGIAGEGARVVAAGNVRAGHIRDGEAMAHGDIAVGDYVGHARVRAGGRLVVEGTGDAIMGGETYATIALEVGGTVGSSSGESTVVGIMADPESAARLAKVHQGLRFCETDILRILRTLGLKNVDKAQIQAVFQRTPTNKKKFFIDILKQLNQLVKVREELFKKRDMHQDESARRLREAQIRIAGKALAGVQIRMGELEFTLPQDLLGPSFYLADGRIGWRTD